MYIPTHVGALSPMQKRKLISGHPVTIKPGKSHVIHLSPENAKKVKKAHEKGKGVRVQMDPYCGECHGTGVFGDLMKKGVAVAKSVAKSQIPAIEHAASQEMIKRGVPAPLASRLTKAAASRASHLLGGKIKSKKEPKKVAKKSAKKATKKGGKLNIGREIVSGLKKIARPALKKASSLAIQGLTDMSGTHEFAPMLEHAADRGINALGRRYGFGMGGALVPP